jgi:hypothetical protein
MAGTGVALGQSPQIRLSVAGTASPEAPQIRLSASGTFILPVDAGLSLLKQCSRDAPDRVSQFWNPSTAQIGRLERLLPQYVRAGSDPRRHVARNVEYHRQYVGIVVDGRRLIYGNFYPASTFQPVGAMARFDEKSTPVVVCDGGPSFWGVVFDPEADVFSDLQVNGPV